jgi:hypothetical protein
MNIQETSSSSTTPTHMARFGKHFHRLRLHFR